MANKIKTLLQGYLSVIREMLFIKNRVEYFNLELNIFWILLILGAIGFLRNALEVVFGINPFGKWYTMDADIIFCMVIFPMVLVFIGSHIIHLVFKAFKIKIPYLKLFSLAFYLQILHLIVPFLDLLADNIYIPHRYFLPEHLQYKYFAVAIYMSLGIIVVWLLTMLILVKVFARHFRVNVLVTIPLLIISYIFLFIPLYYIFPVFNIAFNSLVGADLNPYVLFWGYGVFFFLWTIISIGYYRRQLKKEGS